MSKILAIEIENFQSIKDRARIDLAPITLLFGPNSAGKSAVFDALELIECLWDPTRFNEAKATNMITRWARREGQAYLPLRLAVEFGYEFNKDISPRDLWDENENWLCNKARSAKPCFHAEPYMQEDYPEDFADFEKTIIRLEIEIVMAGEGKAITHPVVTELKISSVEKLIVHYGRSVKLEPDKSLDTWDLRHYGFKTTIGPETPFYKFSELPSKFAEAQNLECNLNIPGLDLRLNTLQDFHRTGYKIFLHI